MHEPSGHDCDSTDYQPCDRPCVALPIGELLVRQGVLSRQQVAHLLDVQAVVGRPLGDLAERLFGVSPPAVESAWAEQFVALNGERDVSRERIDLQSLAHLSTRQAWQFRLLPLRPELDEAEGPGHLLMATTRRGMKRAMTFAGRSLPLAPSFVIATPTSLRRLLERHYPVPEHLANWAFDR